MTANEQDGEVFNATVWVAEDPQNRIRAQVAVTESRLMITAKGATIGDWSHDEIDLTGRGTRFELGVDGERLVIDLRDGSSLAGTTHSAPTTPAPPPHPPEPDPDNGLAQYDALRPSSTQKRGRRRRGRHLR